MMLREAKGKCHKGGCTSAVLQQTWGWSGDGAEGTYAPTGQVRCSRGHKQDESIAESPDFPPLPNGK